MPSAQLPSSRTRRDASGLWTSPTSRSPRASSRRAGCTSSRSTTRPCPAASDRTPPTGPATAPVGSTPRALGRRRPRWTRSGSGACSVLGLATSASTPAGQGCSCLTRTLPARCARLCADLGAALPATFTVSTGKGTHYYYCQPEGLALGNGVGRLAAYGVDIRGCGGYVVGPGFTHQTGRRYEVVDPTPRPPRRPARTRRGRPGASSSPPAASSPVLVFFSVAFPTAVPFLGSFLADRPSTYPTAGLRWGTATSTSTRPGATSAHRQQVLSG